MVSLARRIRAGEAFAERGQLGALHGAPMAVKAILDTAGMPTTSGSPRILGSNVPGRIATAVERLEQAVAAVLLGKLHMTEFAFIAHHPETHLVRNPYAILRYGNKACHPPSRSREKISWSTHRWLKGS